MRLLNKNVYYSIRSLLYIAQKQGRVISVSELVTKLKMRRAFLRKILQILSKHKILRSIKGKEGGFALNIKPFKLRIIDIIKIFHSKANVINCLLEKNICPHPNTCVLMAKVKDIEKTIYETFKRTTVASLLKHRQKNIEGFLK